jgi:hypothetical protein
MAEDKMTVRQKKARHAMMAAILASGLIGPVWSQQEPGGRQTSAGLRAGERVLEAPEIGQKRLANIPSTTVSLDGRGNPLWSRSLASFTATRERPLFNATRRAPAIPMGAPTQVQQLPAMTGPPLALVGAISGEKDGMAIFLEETTKNVIRLRTGESHQGWILRSVQRREVTLERDRQTATLGLGPD